VERPPLGIGGVIFAQPGKREERKKMFGGV